MKLTIDGIEYIHGATHAGLDCWLKAALVPAMEVSYYLGQPIGDWCKDQLIRYLAGPDEYRNEDVVITGANDTRKRWPLKNMHRDTYATKNTDKLPERAAGDEWPKWAGSPASGWVARWDAPNRCEEFRAGGVAKLNPSSWDHFKFAEIPLARVTAFLRANGHAAEADKLEPRHPSAGQAGVRVFGANGFGYTRVIVGDAVWARNDGTQKWFRDGNKPHTIVSGAWPELHGPEADKIVSDLCAHVPSAAAILNAKG